MSSVGMASFAPSVFSLFQTWFGTLWVSGFLWFSRFVEKSNGPTIASSHRLTSRWYHAHDVLCRTSSSFPGLTILIGPRVWSGLTSCISGQYLHSVVRLRLLSCSCRMYHLQWYSPLVMAFLLLVSSMSTWTTNHFLCIRMMNSLSFDC